MPLTREEKLKGYVSFQNEVVDPATNTVIRRYTQPSAPPVPAVAITPTSAQTPATMQNLALGSQYATPLLTSEQFARQRAGGVDEAAIREETRKNMQASIDAINAYYADLVSREQETGEARLGKVRAVNVGAGLAGSSFATARDLEQRALNERAVRGIEAERNFRMQEAMGRIDEIARQEIAARKQEALGNAEAYTQYLTKAREDARLNLAQLAGAGVDLEQIDQQRRAYLFQVAGYDSEIGPLVYNSLKPKPEQLDYRYIEQADGSILAIAPDPTKPGQFVEHRIEGASPDIGLVIEMIRKYPDAGISTSDDLATAGAKIQSSRIYKEQVRPPITGGGGVVITSADTPMDARVKQIIAANPDDPATGTGWGTAADQIDAQFGPGTATKYDSWLKAVYQTGQNPYSLQGQDINQPTQSQYQIQTNARILQSVDELLPLVNRNTVGALGKLTYKIPGSPAYNFNAQLDTLKSNIAFGALTAMREASKSGGALGQVSDREGKLLESSLAALDIGQSPDEFKKQLQKIKDSIDRWNQQVSQGDSLQSKSNLTDDQAYQEYLKLIEQ